MILKAIVAIAIVATLAFPWLILINRREPNFLPTIIGHDVYQRMTSGLEGHKAPPGYYLVSIVVTFLPWSLFLPGALLLGWRRRDNPLVRFCFASVIGPWLMFEIIRTKLPFYVLPVFPPLAVLTALAIPRKRYVACFGCAIGALAIVAVAYGLILPRVDALQTSRRVAEILRADGATLPGQERMIDYKEPSLAFYQGGTIREESDNGYLLHTPSESWPKWIVLTQAIWNSTPPATRQQFDVIGDINGWWYVNRGHKVHVIVLRRR